MSIEQKQIQLQDERELFDRLNSLQSSVRPLREQLIEHEIYTRIETLSDLRLFMEHHVFAVWDFMTLLKALQRHLTCVEIPWVPRGNYLSRRLINEIVLAEESDFLADAVTASSGRPGYISHFELYKAAMEQCGADTTKIDQFLDLVRQGDAISEALEKAGAPATVRGFVETTWSIVESGSVPSIAVAFTLGREAVVPDMFKAIVADLHRRFAQPLGLFQEYLERHIHLDGEEHMPMALMMLTDLCGNDDGKWNEAQQTAQTALIARIAFWDGVVEQINVNRA